MPYAVRVHQQGGPDVLSYEEVDQPTVGPNEVLIRQYAAGLNFIDVYHRTGYYPVPSLPFVPGVEGAGVVESVGADVESIRPGERVAYVTRVVGSYAEYRVIPESLLVKLPDAVSFEQAAAMMLKGMTARYLLRQTYPVSADETILVHAAAGGVGLILGHGASLLGATVSGRVGSEETAALARANGCTHTILYTQEDVAARVREITGGALVRVVYDSVGQATFEQSLKCLAPRGLLVSFGQSSGAVSAFDPVLLSRYGSLYMTRPTLFDYIDTREELEQNASELFEAVVSGAVSIPVRQTFALEAAAEAHRALESRRTTGSTVLTIA